MSENKIHADCYIWFHNNFPYLRGLLCYNLNNSKNAIDGAKNKAMGLQPGRSDMVLYYCGNAYMIEFKTETGIQSYVQEEWQIKIEKQGFKYIIIRSLEEFKQFILEIIENK